MGKPRNRLVLPKSELAKQCWETYHRAGDTAQAGAAAGRKHSETPLCFK